jgi:hypothetical protein
MILHIYDFTYFEHTGDGITGTYLMDYRHKNIDEEFHYYHTTDEPYEIMKFPEKHNISFVCYNYFGKKIPKTLYYDKHDIDGKKIYKHKNKRTIYIHTTIYIKNTPSCLFISKMII